VAAPLTASDVPAVLLVDDRRENLLALEAVLAPLNVRLVTAQSGEQALKALLNDSFATILLDVQMPGMDGFETAQVIRGREATKSVPIIFVTALSRDLAHVARGYEAGAVDYVLKPFDPFVLRSKVQVFCDLERHQRERERADELLRRAWDSAPTGVALLDEHGRLLRTNPALRAMADRNGTDLTGQPLAELFTGDDRARLRLVLERQSSDDAGPPEALEIALQRGDGSLVPVDALVSAFPGMRDRPPGVFVQLEDLRERRRAQRAQHRLVAEQTARAQAEALAARLAKVAAVTEGIDHLPLERLVATLAERIVDVLGVDGACVSVLGDEETPPVRAAHGEDVPEDLLRSAAAEGRPRSGGTGALAVPLRVEGRVMGVVGVTGAGRRGGAGPELPGLLRHASERSALIIERARLYDRERRIAATLQEDLMPDTLPEVPGVAIAAHFQSGGSGTQVGGDWYDALALPGGRLGVVIGDVAGRGVAAAARMGELRAVSRAYALEGHPPAEVVRRLNAYQLAQGTETMATLCYAVVEPALGQMRYVSAGHVPPLLLTPGQRPRYLARGGPPLGVLDICNYDETVVPFAPGSLLTIYTDGLVERRGEILDVGLERLSAAVAGAGPDPFTAREAALSACLQDDAGDDDVTAVFVHAEPALGRHPRFVLTPDPEALGALRGALRRWLTEIDATPDEAGEITLAANEAWQNAIEHGNAFAAVPITVELEVADDGEVTVTVRDLGHDGTREPDPDRGRGILLMRELMDDAAVDVDGPHGGTVTLRRRLRSGRAARTPAFVSRQEA
jgi:PAS domain S-box-containing protein